MLNKMKNKSKYIMGMISLVLLFPLFNSNNTSSVSADTSVIQQKFTVEARASMVIDADSEQILQKQNETEPLPVLSASKLLSTFIVLDEIKGGRLKLDDMVTISEKVADLSQETLFSNVPLIAGKSYTVKELLSASLVVSGNGSIAALAEKVAGSESAFVIKMREKAKELGMKNTFIFTSSGLSTEEITVYGLTSDEIGSNQMSARDGAILSLELIKQHPEVIEYTKKSVITFPETAENSTQVDYRNVNAMLPDLNESLFYKGVQGLKTGSSDEENSATFFGYYDDGGKKLITIIIGAKTKETRFTETSKLLDFATKKLKYHEIVNSKSNISAKQFSLIKGDEKSVDVTTKEKVGVYTDQTNPSYTTEFIPNKTYYREYNNAFSAPIKQDAELGKLSVTVRNVEYLREKKIHTTINLVSKKEYKEGQYAKIQDVQDFITNIFR